jgi:hypothetical protein
MHVDTIDVDKGVVRFYVITKPLTKLEIETRAQNPTGARPSRLDKPW